MKSRGAGPSASHEMEMRHSWGTLNVEAIKAQFALTLYTLHFWTDLFTMHCGVWRLRACWDSHHEMENEWMDTNWMMKGIDGKLIHQLNERDECRKKRAKINGWMNEWAFPWRTVCSDEWIMNEWTKGTNKNRDKLKAWLQ